METIFKEAVALKEKKKAPKAAKAELLDFTGLFKKKVGRMPLRPIRVKKSKIRNADLAEVLTPRENKENQP